jgi:lysine 2,3-aminomutase
MKNRITTLAQLETHLRMTPEERAGVRLANSKLAMAIPPYFMTRVDPMDPICPVRRQVIPRMEEMAVTPSEMTDPCGEDQHMVVPGLVHRYPDRVLFLVTDRCAAYCRYCTRSRVVSGVGEQQLETDHEAALAYLHAHSEVRDVLLSGGDPLLFSDEKLDSLLGRIRAIPHIQFVRIGSRIPIFLPQRITPGLVAILRKYHPLFLSVHVNHPKELTRETLDALELLADAGVVLGNQSVLLRGVNDSIAVMRDLVQKLLMARVRPYYLYQCDLIQGTDHLRSSVERGTEIIHALRGFTSGYAVPQFVVDGPGGGGKIPINPEYLLGHDGENYLLRNFRGDIYAYPSKLPSPTHLPSASFSSMALGDEVQSLGQD